MTIQEQETLPDPGNGRRFKLPLWISLKTLVPIVIIGATAILVLTAYILLYSSWGNWVALAGYILLIIGTVAALVPVLVLLYQLIKKKQPESTRSEPTEPHISVVPTISVAPTISMTPTISVLIQNGERFPETLRSNEFIPDIPNVNTPLSLPLPIEEIALPPPVTIGSIGAETLSPVNLIAGSPGEGEDHQSPRSSTNVIMPSLSSTLFHLGGILPERLEDICGRKAELGKLIRRIREKAPALIIAEDSCGKSWLLWLLKLYLDKHPETFDFEFQIGYMDADTNECNTVAGFVEAALKALGKFENDELAQCTMALLERRVKKLRRDNFLPILCIDHFETLNTEERREEFNQKFFQYLRSIANPRTPQQNLVLMVASNIQLKTFAQDIKRFYNLFVSISLEPFTQEEAREFIQAKNQFIQANIYQFSSKDQDLLLRYTRDDKAWLPFKLQIACQTLYDDKNDDRLRGQKRRYRPNDPEYWSDLDARIKRQF